MRGELFFGELEQVGLGCFERVGGEGGEGLFEAGLVGFELLLDVVEVGELLAGLGELGGEEIGRASCRERV